MMNSWLLLLFLVLLEFRWIRTTKIACPNTMDFCKTERTRCLRTLSDLPPCSKNFPRLVFSSSGVLGFESHTSEIEIRQSEIRFSLFHLINGLWIPIKSCCQVAAKESCQLTPKRTGKYISVAWIRNEGRAFCSHQVETESQRLRWCDGIFSNQCVTLRNGDVQYSNISSARSRRRTDAAYCLFHSPNKYGQLGQSTFDRNVVKIRGMELHGDRVITDDFETNCMLVESSTIGVLSRLSSYNYRAGFTACAFVRMKGYGWIEEPVCLTDGLPECHHDFVRHLSVLGMLLGVFMLVGIVSLAAACRRYFKTYMPSYQATVATGFLSQIVGEETAQETSCDSENSSFTHADTDHCLGEGQWTNKSERYITTSHLYPSCHVEYESVCAIVPVTHDLNFDDTSHLLNAMEQDLQYKHNQTEEYSHSENGNKKSPKETPPGTNDADRIYPSKSCHDLGVVHSGGEYTESSTEAKNSIAYLPKPISVSNSYTSK